MSMETLKYATEVKAKKEHRCNFCGEKILIGEVYNTSTHKYDGTVYDWKSHLHCSKIASTLKMYDDCDEGLTEDMFQETISSVYLDLMNAKFSENEIIKYSEVFQQLRYVRFKNKLMYVIHHYNKTTHP